MNQPLVKIENGRPITSSVAVANYFDRKHKDVLKAVRDILAVITEDFSRRNFTPRDYKDSRGQKQPCWWMTQDGFAMTALGFTGTKALQFREAYVTKFREMADQLVDNQLKSLEHEYVEAKYVSDGEEVARPFVGLLDACKHLRILGVHLTLTPGQLKGMIKRGEYEGCQDRRGHWCIYVDEVTRLATGH